MDKKYFESLNIPEWDVKKGLAVPSSGQAQVLEVEHKSTGKLGVFRFLKRTEEVDVKRFNRELAILTNNSFKHQNIVNILEFTKHPDQYWYISEKGEVFDVYWKARRFQLQNDPNTLLAEALSIILKILDGLTVLHDQMIVHRDIKPKNIIMVGAEPVLIDFGLVFNPEEERISPLEGPVGNARYSPDQMMNRMEFVPPWLDLFELSQVFIWMTMKRPKTDKQEWSRPLDWRWVPYSEGLQENKVLAIRALTAICSDFTTGPQNAREMSKLINNLFNANPKLESNPLLNEVLEKISVGNAKSLIAASEDMAMFITVYPIYSKIHVQIENFLKELVENNSDKIPIQFLSKSSINNWKERVESITKFTAHEVNYPFDVICGGKEPNNFFLTCSNVFWVPSLIPVLNGTSYLPDNFLPIAWEFGIGSDNSHFEQKRDKYQAFIALDNSGQLWKSLTMNDFKTSRSEITLATLFGEFQRALLNPDSWELIQR